MNNSDHGGIRFVKSNVSPHLFFFWIYNLIYFLPLLIIFFWGYSEGGAADAISLDSYSLIRIATLYIEGLLAFTIGSVAVSYFYSASTKNSENVYQSVSIGAPEFLVVASVVILFVCSKAALIPMGVYHAYAADTGEMTGGAWSFSMVCAEFMIFVAVLVLFSSSRRNVGGFVLVSTINGINLLHGTRILFIVTVLLSVFYAYVRGILTLKRGLIFGPLVFAAVLMMTYGVFLSRSSADTTDLTYAKALSPIVYESLFSQLSLKSVVTSPDLMSSTGALPDFLLDQVISVTPRAILPQKDTLPYLNRFGYLSPLGALNGYAAGVIYFGVFWPFFYLLLGAFASWLQARSREGPYFMLLYAYFTADVLFRFMRDGYLIPVKIFINILELLAALIVFKTVLNGLSGKAALSRRVTGK